MVLTRACASRQAWVGLAHRAQVPDSFETMITEPLVINYYGGVCYSPGVAASLSVPGRWGVGARPVALERLPGPAPQAGRTETSYFWHSGSRVTSVKSSHCA
jgi:hypothetical protein